eukprot:6206747-Pleurochrysis_carterae.AAC.3
MSRQWHENATQVQLWIHRTRASKSIVGDATSTQSPYASIGASRQNSQGDGQTPAMHWQDGPTEPQIHPLDIAKVNSLQAAKSRSAKNMRSPFHQGRFP